MVRNKAYAWTENAEKEFEYLRKRVLDNVKELKFFNKNDKIELIVDASPIGLGAVLIQRNVNNALRIIACASKSLSPTEKRYPQTQKEALAVVWGVERFRFYLFGRDFTVLTDSEANEFIFNDCHRLGKRAITRAESWALRLQPYRFKIARVPGTDNIADVFSRLIKESQTDDPFDTTDEYHTLFTMDDMPRPLLWTDIAEATDNDVELCKVIEFIASGVWPKTEAKELRLFRKSLYSIGGVLIYKDRFICPKSLQGLALQRAHEGHFGSSSMKRMLSQYLWWPGMSKEIEESVRSCETCARISLVPKPVPIQSRRLPDGPMENIQVDFLYVAGCGSQELLMVTDTFSRMFWAIEVKKTDTKSTINALEKIFNIWGRPRYIQSDNGPPFNSEHFSQHWKELGIRHDLSVPYCPWMNGMVERLNRNVIKALQSAKCDATEWRSVLEKFVNKYNNEIPHSTTGFTPFELMTGRKYKGFFPSLSSLRGGTKTVCYEDLRIRDAERKDKSAQHTDKTRAAKESEISVGDWVLITNKNMSNKLDSRFKSDHYLVMHREGVRLALKNTDGKEISRWISDVKKVPMQFQDLNFRATNDNKEKSQKFMQTEAPEELATSNENRKKDTTGERESEEPLTKEQETSTLRRSNREIRKPKKLKDFVLFNIFG